MFGTTFNLVIAFSAFSAFGLALKDLKVLN